MAYQFDHRQLADEMEICFFNSDEIGGGLPVWLPNGVAIREALEKFVGEKEKQAGYVRVASPHLGAERLYRKSGHLEKFSENMFPPVKWPDSGVSYYLRPMNCPHHHLIFSHRIRSYRDLPLRVSEYGQVYRFENSGNLRGLSRVRGLCQNDAHIYVEPSHAQDEICQVLRLFEVCYSQLQLSGYQYRLSLGSPQERKSDPGAWSGAEQILRESLKHMKLPFFEADGEGAFYGPKIDVQMRMGASREESIASVQLDFLSARRFDLRYSAPQGELLRPLVIHRAPLGSHERFIALLLEYFDGQLPGWLAPIQVQILPVSNAQAVAAGEIGRWLRSIGIRAHEDCRPLGLSQRLKASHKLRPFSKLIVGERELESGRWSLQIRDERLEVERWNLPGFMAKLLAPP